MAEQKRGGRKKGTPNKATAAVKAALTEAFDKLGGVPALVRWAKDQPAEFYKLWSKMLPIELKNAGGSPLVEIAVRVVDEPEPEPEHG